MIRKWIWSSEWNDADRVNRRTVPVPRSATTIIWPDLGMNPLLHGGKLTSNCLTYDTARQSCPEMGLNSLSHCTVTGTDRCRLLFITVLLNYRPFVGVRKKSVVMEFIWFFYSYDSLYKQCDRSVIEVWFVNTRICCRVSNYALYFEEWATLKSSFCLTNILTSYTHNTYSEFLLNFEP
jgi:hypothetical protein